MFCKVCKDAGKKESEYTSHWVRNAPGPGGKVVCPTLLKTVCKYCKAKGHIIKFCPKLKGKYVLPPKQEQHKAPESQFQQRARELCSSPPPRSEPARSAPAPYKGTVIPFDPTPIGEKPNYFQSLSVDNERTNSNGAERKSYKKDLDTDFPALGEKNPALGEEKTKKIVNARFPTTIQSYSSKAAAIATATTAIGTAKYEREDSPTPSPVSSRPHSPPPAPKKMPQVKEEEDAEYCEGAPSPSSLLSHTPPPPPTMTTSWGDMEIDD